MNQLLHLKALLGNANGEGQHQTALKECDRITLTLDEREQLHPEQSTTAIVTYHPVAKYFSA
jgi:cobalamin-dependent methionine synthase I